MKFKRFLVEQEVFASDKARKEEIFRAINSKNIKNKIPYDLKPFIENAPDLVKAVKLKDEIIAFIEGWSDSCWEGLTNKIGYSLETMSKEDNMGKFINERLTPIATSLGLTIIEWFFTEDEESELDEWNYIDTLLVYLKKDQNGSL